MGKDIFISPMFISAKSPEELAKAMLANNFKWNATFEYFNIQKEGKLWYAWYYHNFRDHKLPKIVTFEEGK